MANKFANFIVLVFKYNCPELEIWLNMWEEQLRDPSNHYMFLLPHNLYTLLIVVRCSKASARLEHERSSQTDKE